MLPRLGLIFPTLVGWGRTQHSTDMNCSSITDPKTIETEYQGRRLRRQSIRHRSIVGGDRVEGRLTGWESSMN